MNLSEYFVDGEIRNYIESSVEDPWQGTIFEKYSWISAPVKGVIGEKLVSKIMLKRGCQVFPAVNIGHDRVIDGYKTEIKFSLSVTNIFKFNHLSFKKDWDRTILLGVNSEDVYDLHWFKKEDFIEHINSKENLFRRQQGGVDGGNDDYMIDHNFELLKKTTLLQNIDTWSMHGPKKTGIELFMSHEN